MKPVHVVLPAAFLMALGTAACAHHHHQDVYAEPAPVGYVYEPGYYDRGYYRGNDWYWQDRNGRVYHEGRDEHERHMRDFNGRREGERDRY